MIDAPEDWEVSLGIVVWGCVRGHPWWPARISINEKQNTWYNAASGKIWVTFFNDGTCAWLKRSELRPFDSYFRDACLKLNAAKRRFRRHEESITMAIALAEEYIRVLSGDELSYENNATQERRTVLKLRLKPFALDRSAKTNGNGQEGAVVRAGKGTGRKVGRPRKSSTISRDQRKSKENGGGTNDLYTSVALDLGSGMALAKRKERPPSSSAEDLTDNGINEVNGNGRARRKRRRPARLEDGFVMDKRLMEKGVIPYPASRLVSGKPTSEYYGEGLEGAETRGEVTSREKTPTGKGGRQIMQRLRIPKERGLGERSKLARFPAGSPSPRSSSEGLLGASRRTQRPRSLPINLGSVDYSRRQKLVEDVTLTANLSRHLHALDGTYRGGIVKDEDESSNSSTEPIKISKALGRQIRISKEKQRELDSEATESDSDLLEDRLRGGEYPSQKMEGDIHGALSVQIQQILKRISKLEKDCQGLKLKAALDEKAKLGEDATAAGLKNAVMALASAAATFARKREHDIGALSRAVDLLWTDQDQDVPADVSLLRSVTKSLVFAESKRHANKEVRAKFLADGAGPAQGSNEDVLLKAAYSDNCGN